MTCCYLQLFLLQLRVNWISAPFLFHRPHSSNQNMACVIKKYVPTSEIWIPGSHFKICYLVFSLHRQKKGIVLLKFYHLWIINGSTTISHQIWNGSIGPHREPASNTTLKRICTQLFPVIRKIIRPKGVHKVRIQ